MFSIGLILGTYIAMRRAKGEGLNPNIILDTAVVSVIVGVVGARILYVLEHWADFSSSPLSIVMVNKGGLVAYGGLLIGVPTGIWYVRSKGLSVWKAADICGPSIPLVESISRIGCFLAGCCYGRPWEKGVVFPALGDGIPRIPTQLISSAVLFLIFLSLVYYSRARHGTGQVFWMTGILYSIYRFLIDFLRENDSFLLRPLTTAQFISILVIGLSVYMFLWMGKRGRAL
jgi:phosphatidylglycerol:prolipoprotein diacylglycerol transferase